MYRFGLANDSCSDRLYQKMGVFAAWKWEFEDIISNHIENVLLSWDWDCVISSNSSSQRISMMVSTALALYFSCVFLFVTAYSTSGRKVLVLDQLFVLVWLGYTVFTMIMMCLHKIYYCSQSSIINIHLFQYIKLSSLRPPGASKRSIVDAETYGRSFYCVLSLATTLSSTNSWVWWDNIALPGHTKRTTVNNNQ